MPSATRSWTPCWRRTREPSKVDRSAAYGHFGRTDVDLPWERTDRVDALRDAAGP
ncbi:hypothetical protein GTS_51880 [Gandjariella thermophila]|uniref:S-adenosylmethionine synthetase C-terminal domain-containing protein n=1 Tax=Gandjariella thermophila TaxID=1931992 RepID=A0A4D4J9R0_9PSEU|nr:hypothetical protein GTS_51880 [Gandjariella thermophila]